jgi:hypothetical protein
LNDDVQVNGSSTVRYLGVEVAIVLDIPKKIDV